MMKWVLFITVIYITVVGGRSCSETQFRDEDGICVNLNHFTSSDGSTCIRCPPGTYMKEECTAAQDIVCQECPSNTYTAFQNYVPNCFRCSKCSAPGQHAVSPCTKTKNAVCECKDGYFQVAEGICYKHRTCSSIAVPGDKYKDNVCQTFIPRSVKEECSSSTHTIIPGKDWFDAVCDLSASNVIRSSRNIQVKCSDELENFIAELLHQDDVVATVHVSNNTVTHYTVAPVTFLTFEKSFMIPAWLVKPGIYVCQLSLDGQSVRKKHVIYGPYGAQVETLRPVLLNFANNWALSSAVMTKLQRILNTSNLITAMKKANGLTILSFPSYVMAAGDMKGGTQLMDIYRKVFVWYDEVDKRNSMYKNLFDPQ